MTTNKDLNKAYIPPIKKPNPLPPNVEKIATYDKFNRLSNIEEKPIKQPKDIKYKPLSELLKKGQSNMHNIISDIITIYKQLKQKYSSNPSSLTQGDEISDFGKDNSEKNSDPNTQSIKTHLLD